MSTLRYELIHATINRATTLTDTNIYNDIHKQFEFHKQTLLADKILTNDEKTYTIRWITKGYDRDKVMNNDGTKRICENCKQECLAVLYCEYCVRNYLKEDFSNWTSGNDVIDNLIQKCQLETTRPNVIVEWIPYSNLGNIKYLTKEMDNLEMNKVEENYTSSRLSTSKIHNFENLPEPRNATEDSNKKSSKLFKKLQIKSNNDEKEKTQKYVDDDDEVYNNPNFHSKEQDELEIPVGKLLK
ncbi:hypothetical protein C1646_738416 [Rhizophagus diaphanus]|nr:hypothetical protein C1646_738416 [Rhizophagus diaphanus] [Rhizophagus sp. MUCL 43196]